MYKVFEGKRGIKLLSSKLESLPQVGRKVLKKMLVLPSDLSTSESARPSNKEKKDLSRPAYFNPQEKRQLLDLMNEEVKKCKTLLPLVAEALGKTDQLDDSSDVSSTTHTTVLRLKVTF